MFRARLGVWFAALSLVACTTPPHLPTAPDAFNYSAQLEQLLPTDVLILGEQHDVAHHQRIHLAVVQRLAHSQRLGSLALEMADEGNSTKELNRHASEAEVRAALQWQDDAWPWSAYGPAVMAAVRTGVLVAGANLPAARLREAMANPRLDGLLRGPALKAQQQAIRIGHCNLLPESQIAPMTRVQIARDVSMAQTVASLAQTDKTVLLLAGNGHADQSVGVPLQLPPTLKVKTVLLSADKAQAAIHSIANFSQIWATDAAPPTDYCADFEANRSPSGPPAVKTP
ncbi:ChaN family lipoprotein [Rhodoferax sp. PAMC 29310]|uniref:ChaN family lipoprotein n=1 Tax=Rhodoferax sp. PAMC 29310 TaxID=2822760 RepID=UPI001B329AD8|nr:ChaN family lipoprotein [Rhodoferax sp. PAMC 29310]